jgi:O-antigen/teichoic acid export membrane protein
MLDVRHAAAYSLATQLIILIALVINAMSSIAAPMIADYHARADEAGLRRLLRIIGRVNILLVAPLALLIAFAGFRVLAWFGPGYAEAYPALLWLLGACLTATLGGHATLMLTMTGRQHAASVIIGASAVGNLLLSFVLTAKFGVTGTAAATAIAICLRNGALCYWVKRDVGMSVWPW